MAHVQIVIEDSIDGTVKIQSTPSFGELTQMMHDSLEGHGEWSAALDYAMVALVAAVNKSRAMTEKEVT